MNFRSFYLWFGLPVLVIVAWVFLIYMPMDSGAKNREQKLTAIKNERQTLEKSMKDFAGEVTTQKRLQTSYDEFMNQAPVVERMPEYMKNVMNMAKSKGITIGSLSGYYSSLDVSQKAGLVNPVFEMGLRGGFLEMGHFLEDLSSRTAFKSIQAARIDYDEKAYPQLTGKFVIEFKALKGKKSESK
jgi:Tfp pilus assembly protein PilO